MIDILIKYGASINPKNEKGALHAAAAAGKWQMIPYLIDKGANVNARDEKNMTPLHYASRYYYGRDSLKLKVAEILIKYGAIKDLKDNNGKTPLDYAIENKHVIFEKYLRWGVNYGKHLTLFEAVKVGNIQAIKETPGIGIKINEPMNDGETLLHVASRECENEVVKYLLDNGAHIDAIIPESQDTPLMEAIRHRGNVQTVQLLVQKGADVNRLLSSSSSHSLPKGMPMGIISFNFTETPLALSLEEKKFEISEFLIKNGADTNKTALVKMITIAGYFPKEIVPLIEAVRNNKLDLVKLMLSKGANINITDKDGTTALMTASKLGYAEIVQLLIQHGADTKMTNKKGQIADDIVKEDVHKKEEKERLQKEKAQREEELAIREKENKLACEEENMPNCKKECCEFSKKKQLKQGLTLEGCFKVLCR